MMFAPAGPADRVEDQERTLGNYHGAIKGNIAINLPVLASYGCLGSGRHGHLTNVLLASTDEFPQNFATLVDTTEDNRRIWRRWWRNKGEGHIWKEELVRRLSICETPHRVLREPLLWFIKTRPSKGMILRYIWTRHRLWPFDVRGNPVCQVDGRDAAVRILTMSLVHELDDDCFLVLYTALARRYAASVSLEQKRSGSRCLQMDETLIQSILASPELVHCSLSGVTAYWTAMCVYPDAYLENLAGAVVEQETFKGCRYEDLILRITSETLGPFFKLWRSWDLLST